MAFLPSSLLLLIYASSHLPQATQAFPFSRREANSFTLSDQFTRVIPTCAQQCFISFLNVNFNRSEIGPFPELNTLCSHNTTSGLTIGEGAVECIVGEDQGGGCSETGVGGDDGSQAVISKVYNICNRQQAALPNTHATLVATLFTSGTALLVAPHPSTTPSSTRTSRGTNSSFGHFTTSTPRTSTAPRPTFTPSTPLVTASGSPTLASSTASPTMTAPSTALPASSTSSISTASTQKKALSTPQKVGVTIGTVGGVAAILALCLFYRWLRRYRNRDRNSGFYSTPESGNSLATRRFTDYSRRHGRTEKGDASPGFAPGGTRDGVAAKISPTFHPRVATPPPSKPTIRLVEDREFYRPTRASRVGLAVSTAPSSAATLLPASSPNDGNPQSRRLPEKPTLALQIPNQTHSRPPGQVFNFPSPPRSKPASIMSRGRPRIEFGPPLKQASNSSKQQAYGNGRRQEPLQPYAQNMPYYAENTPYEQNMALRKYLASEQNLLVKPLEIRRPVQRQQSQRSNGVAYKNKGMTSTSSTFPSTVYQPGKGDPRAIPQPPTRTATTKKTNTPYQRPAQTFGRTESTGSITSFESFESGDDVEVMSPGGTVTLASRKPGNSIDRRKSTKSALPELSPVKESPSPRTPISYPKIPGRLGATVRMIPPPPRPDFGRVIGSGSVNRKPVPAPPGTSRNGEKPWRRAELAAAAARRRSRHGSIHNDTPYQAQPASAPGDTFPKPPPPQNTRTPSPPVYNSLPSQQNLQLQIQSHLRSSPSIIDDRASTASSRSSLLTKRRGEKLAADLVLGATAAPRRMHPTTASREEDGATARSPPERSKWRVLRDAEEIREAKSPGWRPLAGRALSPQAQQQPQQRFVNPYRLSRDVFVDDAAGVVGAGKENAFAMVGGGGGGGVGAGRADGKGGGPAEEMAPGTPGWQPRLTPTRRGDELFLSVQ